MDSSILINWMSPFPVEGVLGVLFHFYFSFDIYPTKKISENFSECKCYHFEGMPLTARLDIFRF